MILLLLACTKTEPEPVDTGDPPPRLALDAEVLSLPEVDLRTQAVSAGTVLLQNLGGGRAEDLTLSFDDSAGASWTAALVGDADLSAGDQRIILVQAEFSEPGLASAQLRVSAGALSDTVVLFTNAHAPAVAVFGGVEGGGDCAARWSGRVSNPGDRALALFALTASLDGVALPIPGVSPNLAILPGESVAFSATLPLDVPEGAELELEIHSDDPLRPVLTHIEALGAQSAGFSEHFVSPGDAVKLVVVHEVNGGASFSTTFEALTEHLDDVARALVESPLDIELWLIHAHEAQPGQFVRIDVSDIAAAQAGLESWSAEGFQGYEDLTRVLSSALAGGNAELLAGSASVAVAMVTDEAIVDTRSPTEILADWQSYLDEGAWLTVHAMSRAPGDACGPGEGELLPQLVEATNGLFHSECMRDWPGFYAGLLAQQSMLHRSMNLGSVADPASMQVSVDGAPLTPDDWTLTGQTLRIADPIPLRVGADIAVRYTELGCP